MSNSTTNLDLISASQASKEVTANSLFDAASPAMLYGRRAVTTAGLTWGYYGGTVMAGGVPTQIANGTVALTPSATNYVEADPSTGAVSANTTGFTPGRTPLYQIITGTGTVTSYADLRVLGGSSALVTSVNGHTGTVVLTASDVGADASGAASDAIAAHDAASDPHPQYLTQTEGDARYAAVAGAVSDGDKGDIVVSGSGTAWSIDGTVLSTFGRTLADDADAATARTTLGLGTVATLASDTDTTLTANSDTRVATQKAVKAYVDNTVTGGAAGVMVFKGVIDCSANPNYPAASVGAVYKVSVAGKLGGASGAVVEVGDTAYCTTTAASGNQATVGSSWNVVQENIDGAVTGPASATDANIAFFNGATGKIVKDSGVSMSTDGTFAGNSDSLLPSQKAVKTYVASAITGAGGGTPGGATTQLQFNDAGAFGGDADLTWDKTNNILIVGSLTTPGKIKGGSSTGNTQAATLTIQGGDALGGTGAGIASIGGNTVITSGAPGATNASSGNITIQPASSQSSGGVTVVIQGATDTNSNNGGKVTVQGGSATGGTATGGDVVIQGGGPTGSGNGTGTGNVVIKTTQGNAGGQTGSVSITAGDGSNASFGNGLVAGSVTITAGKGGTPTSSFNGGNGGALTFSAGLGGNGSGAGAPGTGGAVNINSGAGGTSGTGNANGGNIVFTPGAGAGTGARGNVVLNGTGAALATTATGGFTCVPACAGAPTGTPANIPTGTVPMVFDTTNFKIWIYISGAWKGVALA